MSDESSFDPAAEETESALGRNRLRPREERLRDAGQQIILRVLALLRVGRSYQVGNQAFRVQRDHFIGVFAPVAEEFGEATLIVLENDFYLNGVRVPMTRASLRHHQAAAKEFERRMIVGLRGTRGMPAEEVEKLFTLFLQPAEFYSTGLLEAAQAAGCEHFLPVIHASTAAPGSGGGGPGEGDSTDWPEPGAVGVHRGGEAFGGGDAGSAPGSVIGGAPRGAAPKHFHAAIAGARSLLTATSLQDGMEMRHAKRVVQPLVDGALAGEPVIMGLATLGHHDEYTYMHAVNVCMVAVTMGRELGLERRALADIGVVALLHDVGKNSIGDQLQKPIDEWTDEDRALAQTHPIEGAKLLARSTTLNETTLRCIRVSLEHHAGPGGYPDFGDVRPSVLSRIVSCADCYASLQTHRSVRGQTITPFEALGMMLGPMARRFEGALLWALVRSVGFYPPGQLLQLNDGTVALVLAPNPDDLSRPHVRVILDGLGNWMDAEHPVEHLPLPDDLAVERALRLDEYPESPNTETAA